LGERLRDVIGSTPFETEDGDVVVTISVGVARMKRSTASLMQLLSEADKAQYRAKDKGRNTVSD
jgi:diguanylate cyclase (GGDEF)-like protein